MELLVSLGERMNVRMVDMHLVMVPCRNVYNCILEKPFFMLLDLVASTVNLKIE